MFASDKKLEYLDFAGDAQRVNLTEVRYFDLPTKLSGKGSDRDAHAS